VHAFVTGDEKEKHSTQLAADNFNTCHPERIRQGCAKDLNVKGVAKLE
jgi:hypothetical protein